MKANALTYETQPDKVRELAADARAALWISTANVDGSWVCISRYHEDIWQLDFAKRNANRARFRIDFHAVPACFREVVKAVMYRYLRRGISGRRRPAAASVVSEFYYLLPFICYISERGIESVSEITESVCKEYVTESTLQRKQRGRVKSELPLSPPSLTARFRAVERFYTLSQHTDSPMSVHPWAGINAARLAGDTERIRGKTPLIPDEAFSRLFKAASTDVERADHLLQMRGELSQLDNILQGSHPATIRKAKNDLLCRAGWNDGLVEYNKALLDIRTACFIVIASLTGCRIHELSAVEVDACYATEGDEGEVYWWMRSVSTKTYEGRTQWMIPEPAVAALKVIEEWAKPHQQTIADELRVLRAADSLDSRIAEANAHLKSLFLSSSASRRTRTLSTSEWNRSLKEYGKKHGISWVFASHQFRRKFANYAARSQFGDLRYLKEHFKHWSMDMTLAYALNESQEMALYAEIDDELEDLKRGVVGGWLDPKEALAGGYGERLAAWRNSERMPMFKNHAAMVAAIAESTAIRSNGHAWCTADDNLCIGNDLDKTRCADGCDNAVVSRIHANVYRGMYDQLKGLLRLKDVGSVGMARISRDIRRCRETLCTLGYDPEAAS